MDTNNENLEKQKKPRTEAQKAAWERALQARQDKREGRKDEKQVKIVEEKIKKIDAKKEKIIKSLPVVHDDISESSEEPEPIIIKRIKKKKPQVVYVESESESDEPPKVEKPKRAKPPIAPKIVIPDVQNKIVFV